MSFVCDKFFVGYKAVGKCVIVFEYWDNRVVCAIPEQIIDVTSVIIKVSITVSILTPV